MSNIHSIIINLKLWNDRRLVTAGLLSKNRTIVNYSYDYLGNCIKESGGSSTVDMEYAVTGEMTKLTKAESGTTTLTQTNVYDHNGQRIKRTENSSELDYYYDQGVMVYTIDGSDVCDSNVLSEDGAVIGAYRSGTYYNYLKDIQGSTTNIIKEDGTLSAAYDYTDFGETTAITGNGFDNQICYTGGIYDESTALYYLNARYYDPEIGRFISQDSYRGSMDFLIPWHLYIYCSNNPVNYVDPSGHAELPNWVINALKNNYLSREVKNRIRPIISAGATAFLNAKGYSLASKLFNHALWGGGKTPGSKIKKTIKTKLKNSVAFKSDIKKNINNTTNLSFAFSTGDLYYAIQKMNYKILEYKENGKTYSVKVKAWDYYNFDEFRKPLFVFSNAANNLGYLLEKTGVSNPYNWSVTFRTSIRK